MSAADIHNTAGEPLDAMREEDVDMIPAEEQEPTEGVQTGEEAIEGGEADPGDEDEDEDNEDDDAGKGRAHDPSATEWEDNDDETSMEEADREFAKARKAKPVNKGKNPAAASAAAPHGRARGAGKTDMSGMSARQTGQKGKAPAKKTKKLQIKEEDLDSSNIVVATVAQEDLDAAFLGFVRVAIVDPDPSVDFCWKVINDREIDNKHRKMMVDSFHARKADWEHPAHVLVDGSKLDPSCLSPSPYPVKELKSLEWNCPPQHRIVEFLSGNHRRAAAGDYKNDLEQELGIMEAKREAHEEAQAKGGQQEITADGQLVDEVDVQLGKKIAKLTAAIEQARLWTLKAYDKRKMEGKNAALALLATNELQPAKAASAQEKVQMMRWNIDAQMKKWTNDHPGHVVPAPGTPAFRKEILHVVMTGNEMKEGVANFLFVEPDNFTLIHDLWQLPYFGLTGKIGLSRLENALGKVSKKDLSKKSSSSMLWRWVVHKLMRDLRLVGTSVEFPDIDDDLNDKACHMNNFLMVLRRNEDPLHITEAIWKDTSYHTEKGRKTSKAFAKVQAFARQNARKRYEKDEDEMVHPENLSVAVWDPTILDIVDKVYCKTFRPLAWTKFGDWKHEVWVVAMKEYIAMLNPLLQAAWASRLEDFGDSDQDGNDALAVREADDKLLWLQKLQQLGGRPLNAPLLCDRFLEDFSEVIMRAEVGFKLLTRTLDPLAQIGVLRAPGSDVSTSGREVFNDYLSYVVGILMNGDRFKFKTLPVARDAFCSWLLANIALIKKCGDTYQTQFLTSEHEAFLSISPNQLVGEAAKLHKKSKDKDKEFMKAGSFPVCLTTALPSVEFTSDDCEAVMKIFRILLDTAPRMLQGGNHKGDTANISLAAQQDLLGRGLSVLSLSDIDKFPCLAILYRHGQPWNNPEFGAKKGKSNGFLGYAYYLYMGWRVYGDTVGRMLALEEYTELRDSLFAFLGTCCQPNLDDFLGDHTERPPSTTFVNWDYKVQDVFVNIHGKLLSKESPKSVNEDGASGTKYAAPTVELFDSAKMTAHTASVKKIIDSIVRHPLTRFDARKGTCNPRIAELAREIASEMIQNALEDEFRAVNPHSAAPYVHVPEEDLLQFLPVLPTPAEPSSRSPYDDLSSFAKLAPKKYRLYCNGLVAEGYAQAKDTHATQTSSSPSPAVRRTSSRRSGTICPQDLNWGSPWAEVDASSLDPATLPDPVAAAQASVENSLRDVREKLGLPPREPREGRLTRAAERRARDIASGGPVVTADGQGSTGSRTTDPPPATSFPTPDDPMATAAATAGPSTVPSLPIIVAPVATTSATADPPPGPSLSTTGPPCHSR